MKHSEYDLHWMCYAEEYTALLHADVHKDADDDPMCDWLKAMRAAIAAQTAAQCRQYVANIVADSAL